MSILIRALGRENKQCYGLKASVTVILDRIGLPWSISLSVVLWQFARFYFGTMSNTRTYGITLKYCVHLRKKVEFLGVGEYCFVVVTNKKGKKVPWFKFVNVTTPFVCSYTFFKCSNQMLGKGTTQYSLLISYHWWNCFPKTFSCNLNISLTTRHWKNHENFNKTKIS